MSVKAQDVAFINIYMSAFIPVFYVWM